MDDSPHTINLIPRTVRTIWLWVFLGVVITGTLQVTYITSLPLAKMTTDNSIAAFDLDGEGSLAVWFSSTTLLAAAFYAFLIFRLQRSAMREAEENEEEEANAYGSAIWWLWAAGCWLLMSVDETASLHEGFKEAMTLLSGTRLAGDGSLWWAIPYALLLMAIGSRVLVDVWPRLLQTVTLVLAGGFYVVAVAAQMGMILPTENPNAIMIEESAEMIGNLMILATMMLQARSIALEIGGIFPPPVRREDPTKKPKATSTARKATSTVHGSHATPPSPTSSTAGASSNAPDGGQGGQKTLTRAEKKALRRRLQQEREERRRAAGG